MASFTSKENIQLLWEVVTNTLNLQSSSSKFVLAVQDIFNQHVRLFANSSETNLRELNKQFLAKLMSGLNQLFPQLKRIHIGEPIAEDTLQIEPTDTSQKKVSWAEDTYENQQSDQLPLVEREPMPMVTSNAPVAPVASISAPVLNKSPTLNEFMKRVDAMQTTLNVELCDIHSKLESVFFILQEVKNALPQKKKHDNNDDI